MNEATHAPIRGFTRQVLVPVGVAASILAADQLTKWFVADWLGRKASVHRSNLLGDVIAIEYVENRGVAFGLLQGQAMFATVLAVLVLALLIRTYCRADTASWRTLCGCGLIVGGAIGNLLDRVRLGYVVNFVAVSAWPKFNVADGAITIGVLLLASRYFRDERREEVKTREGGSAVAPGLILLNHDGDR